MKFDEIKGKTPDQLKAIIVEGKKELLNLRFQQASGELENTSRFAQVRKTIARANTLLKQLETQKAA